METRGLLQPLATRPASALEPAAYLHAPAFSSCTVPVIVYPIWADNYVHTLLSEGEGGYLA